MSEMFESMNYTPPTKPEVVSTIPIGIVRRVHSATTPSGKALRHTYLYR